MNLPEFTVTENRSGKEVTFLKHAWKAQWITHPTESTLDYGVFLFRKNFSLKKIPTQFIVHISADNRYRLFINGYHVCFGPSIGDLSHQRYETINLSDYLSIGKNVIAVEVVNFGEYRKASQQTFQTALIVQGDKDNPVDIDTGGTDWKVIKNHAYTAIPFTSEYFNAYYAAGPCDKIDGKKYPWGWQKQNYNDNHWLYAKKASVEFAAGRGFIYGSTWFLVPRTIPFMEEKYEQITKIVRTRGIKKDASFINGKGPLKIPANYNVTILMDQTWHTTGYPELTFSKGKDSKIKITYAEALIDHTLLSQSVTDGNLLLKDLKGNRDKIEDKSILGYYDIILPDGGDNRIFRPLSKRTYRFIQFDIETGNEELVLEKFHGVYTAYPFKEKAKFITDDPFLKKVWKTAWRTLRNSADESFFDPYYEQLQYIGDTRIESLISIYVSGDDRLMRKAIQQFDDSRIPEGLTQSRYPSYIVQVIPTYSLLWINMIHDFFMYRNDPAFIKNFFPGIKSVLDWFVGHVDNTNLLTGLSWWNFTDWANGFPNGIPPGADYGYSANISLQFVKALEKAVEIFSYFALDTEANHYKLLAERIKRSIMQQCYDPLKGLIAETPAKKQFSQHTNILAILTNTISKEKQTIVMDKILYDKSLIRTTIYFKFYLFRALQKIGYGDKYLELLHPWKCMIDMGMTTFGETDKNPRSECHAWSASPCFDFLNIVAGIYPAEPFFKSVIVEPSLGNIQRLNVYLPHPKGMINVKYRKSKDILKAMVSLPLGVTGIFKWRKKEKKLFEGKQEITL